MLLDMVIDNGVLGWIIVAIIVLFVFFAMKWTGRRDKITQLEKDIIYKDGLITEKQLRIEKNELDAKGFAQELATKQFEEWKGKELNSFKIFYETAADNKYKILFGQWIAEHEKRIRKDSAHKSLKVNLGKVSEHLLPFSEQFKQFNSKDARFIGSPIDLIVFDGYADDKEEIFIYFIEVKSGTSVVTKKEKKIRAAIENCRIGWKEMRIEDKNLNLELDT